jgi:acetoin utilization protein AcuB
MKKSAAAQVTAIDRFMTPLPRAIDRNDTLAEARKLMRELGARHLPVVEAPEGKVVGMVSERDILFLESRMEVDEGRVLVESAMQTDVYGVARDTPVDEVALTMASQRYGSAVVWSGSAVVGIFTTVDALRALAVLVRREMVA